MNNNSRRKQRITALTLVATLLMGGCSNEKKNDCFELTENENNELIAMDDSYIDNGSIDDYYVIEVYNKVTLKNEIYIARSKGGAFIYEFYDIFTNLQIWEVGFTDTIFKLVESKQLSEYIVAFGLGQAKYSYEDMKNIYEVIKENYVFESDNSLSRRRVIDNRM